MIRPRRRARLLVRAAAVSALAAAALAGCSAGQRLAASATRPIGRLGADLFGSASVLPQEARVDALAGEVLVMPVRLAPGVDPRRGVVARLDDGRPLAAGLYRVGIDPAPAASAARWLDPPGAWTVTAAAEEPPQAALAFWVLVAHLPADARGQSLWIGATDRGRARVALNWIGADSPPDAPPAFPVPAAPPEARVSTYLRWLLEPERAAPTRRWRARLVAASLGDPAPDEPAAPDAFAHPVLEAMARQGELRWRLALDRLARADEPLALSVAARLARVASVDGVWAPAWTLDQAALDALLFDLLNPRLADAPLAERVRAWLAAEPPAAAIVADDTLADAQGRRVATVSITNLLPEPRLCFAGRMGAGADLSPAPALGFVRVEAPLPAPAPPSLDVGAGSWRAAAAIEGPRPAHPPGAALAPFRPDWTLSAWLRGPDAAPALPADAPWGTGVLLHRVDVAGGEAPSGAGPAWALYVECRVAPGADPGRDTVRVWVGPYTRPTAVLRVTPDGRVTSERRAAAGAAAALSSVRVAHALDRWSFQVQLPAGSVDRDGLLRLAVERTDGSGRRAAWPRAMLPWHTEPARALVDTSAWRSLGDPSPAP